jgi:hypothetical protein
MQYEEIRPDMPVKCRDKGKGIAACGVVLHKRTPPAEVGPTAVFVFFHQRGDTEWIEAERLTRRAMMPYAPPLIRAADQHVSWRDGQEYLVTNTRPCGWPEAGASTAVARTGPWNCPSWPARPARRPPGRRP